MAVPILVVAGHDLGQGGLDVGQVAFLFRQGRGVLHQVEHGPASPWAAVERKSRISSFRVTERAAAPRLPSSSSSGRPSWRSLRTCSRESSWRVTLKEGFSVVVAIMVRSPDSSSGRKKSCCAFEKRCSSSSTRISTPVSWRRSCCKPVGSAQAPGRCRPGRVRAGGPAWICRSPEGRTGAGLEGAGLPRSVVRRSARWLCPTKRASSEGRRRSGRG